MHRVSLKAAWQHVFYLGVSPGGHMLRLLFYSSEAWALPSGWCFQGGALWPQTGHVVSGQLICLVVGAGCLHTVDVVMRMIRLELHTGAESTVYRGRCCLWMKEACFHFYIMYVCQHMYVWLNDTYVEHNGGAVDAESKLSALFEFLYQGWVQCLFSHVMLMQYKYYCYSSEKLSWLPEKPDFLVWCLS